ncbi:MAG: tol-pal system-associated acyl-CoA thioesterase [Tepidimonas sp.]|uniref:tol-pal system-associated acyl-CoA thioesterase n=1 Tax=Tepidimonas sp. TaxID=2002775 RepID=UPI00259D894B|nr:tol-pal system-associated acyl-CoA thioesterase [Tepidimonas sp.]MDM7457344.1 tol-pal system-associated acyl-CoA thioesterase [Tepidimonas sp.]
MHTWPIRVYWEDTDAGGIVYYANYLKFFERARTEWLRRLGLGQQGLRERTGGMFVVSTAEARYLRAARLDDRLDIRTRIRELGRASLTLQQQAWRSDPTPALLCEGTVRIGWVEAESMRPGRLPAEVTAALAGAVAPTTPAAFEKDVCA